MKTGNWTTAEIPSHVGRLAVVTGTGGLGYETALALAAAGAEVVVAGRNAARGALALKSITAAVPTAKVRFELLDLASLHSVGAFAKSLAASDRPIDLLINNAAVMMLPKRQLTGDGFEMQFGTNYLGHYALTAQLLPMLRRSRQARVVQVSSTAHRQGSIQFDDLQLERGYSGWKAYCQSKLAMLMFALELQRRSDADGWGLLSVAAHPGYARTDLVANGPGEKSLFAGVHNTLGRLLSQTAAAGALPTLFAATATEAQPGGYYGPDGFFEMTGAPAAAFIAKSARDTETAKRLWEVSQALTGVSWN